MNLYIAGPRDNEDRYHQEAHTLRAMGHVVHNLAEETIEDARLPRCVEVLCWTTDAVVVLPQWYLSRFAVAEVALARALGLPVQYVSYDGDGTPTLQDVRHRVYV